MTRGLVDEEVMERGVSGEEVEVKNQLNVSYGGFKIMKMFAAAVAALVLLIGVASADMHEATVYVVHGIPGVLVDVEVEGDCALPGFDFGDIAGPLSLPEDTYNIKIRVADAGDPCTGDIVLDVDVPFTAGQNVTVVAYLDDMGNPTAGVFDNDFSPTGRGKARWIVHHTAYAPEVDVKVMREDADMPELVIEDFANGDQEVAESRPGKWNVTLTLPDGMDPVFGPVPVNLKPFTAYQIFAVGDFGGGTFTFLVFPYEGLK
jgi:hypothetical protein